MLDRTERERFVEGLVCPIGIVGDEVPHESLGKYLVAYSRGFGHGGRRWRRRPYRRRGQRSSHLMYGLADSEAGAGLVAQSRDHGQVKLGVEAVVPAGARRLRQAVAPLPGTKCIGRDTGPLDDGARVIFGFRSQLREVHRAEGTSTATIGVCPATINDLHNISSGRITKLVSTRA